MLLTIWLERTFTKNEILEIYLNRVYLGAGTWGVDAASRMYFGISARRVNLWQAAVLAGLPRAPSRFNPRVEPVGGDRARQGGAGRDGGNRRDLGGPRAGSRGAKISFPKASRQPGAWFADWAADQVQSVLPPDADATCAHHAGQPLADRSAETRLAAMLDGPGAAANVSRARW